MEMFKAKWFRYYQGDQVGCRRIAVMNNARDTDYTAIQVWDISPDGDMLLVYQFRKQMHAPEIAMEIMRICRRFDVGYMAIEKDGMGLGVVQEIRREGIAVRAIKARRLKDARSQSAEILMAHGRIFFPHQASFLSDMENELIQFPKSAHTDQVDALVLAAMVVHLESPEKLKAI